MIRVKSLMKLIRLMMNCYRKCVYKDFHLSVFFFRRLRGNTVFLFSGAEGGEALLPLSVSGSLDFTDHCLSFFSEN